MSETPDPGQDLGVLNSLGLVYVTDSAPGITRVRSGRGFSYRDAEGHRVQCKQTLARIRGIVIPPAWADVWICTDERGHLQATGRDARHRKQYRYHPDWSRIRNETKFSRMVEFGEALVHIRETIQRELKKPDLTKDKVVAIALALLDETHIRIGNQEYAKSNRTYGLTTLQDRHAVVEGGELHLHFKAKSGKVQHVDVHSKRLARLVKQCRDIPGQTLFQYLTGDGGHEPISSQDINNYLIKVSGKRFTAKDFRTWAGTVHATAFLWDTEPPATKTARKKKTVEAIRFVAAVLNNTPATCRKYYVHPAVLEYYIDGAFFEIIRHHRTRRAWRGLDRAEKSALKLLVHPLALAIGKECLPSAPTPPYAPQKKKPLLLPRRKNKGVIRVQRRPRSGSQPQG